MLNINENTIDAYKQKTMAQIKEMKAKMKILEASAEKASADMRIEYQKNLDLGEWKSRFDDIETQLHELSSSTGIAWDDMRSGIDKAVNELNDAIESAKMRFTN